MDQTKSLWHYLQAESFSMATAQSYEKRSGRTGYVKMLYAVELLFLAIQAYYQEATLHYPRS